MKKNIILGFICLTVLSTFSLADGSTISKKECKLTKSTWYPYNSVEKTPEYSTYYYNDSGEMAKYTTTSRNAFDTAKIQTKELAKKVSLLALWAGDYNLGTYITLYDMYGETLTVYGCDYKENYQTCHKKHPILIETYHDEDNNSVTKYSEANSGKLLVFYVFNPKGQKIKESNILSMTQYEYNINGLIESEYITNYHTKKNNKYQTIYKKYYKYDKNNNVIQKEIECIKCDEKFKNVKLYQNYKYDTKNNLVGEDGYIPKELRSDNGYSDPYKYAFKYEYDLNGNLIKEIEFMGGLGSNITYTKKYKYDKYNNMAAKYSCEANNDKDCKLYEKLEYDCK